MKTLKNVWHMVAGDRLFSGIYIFGTALSLASCTVLAVLIYAMFAPVYPEYQRQDMAYMEYVKMKEGNGTYQSHMSLDFVRDALYTVESARAVSAQVDEWDDHYVQSKVGNPDFRIRLKPTDPAFFDIYSLEFFAGKPFGKEEFESGAKVAVITERMGQQVFGGAEPADYIGKHVSIDFVDYRVVGVVREGTPREEWSYANAFIPYTSRSGYDRNVDKKCIGSYRAVFLTDDVDALRAEISEWVRRYNSTLPEGEMLYTFNYPIPHVYQALSIMEEENPSAWDYIGGSIGMLIVLLLVPALNLSGIISGRMESRLPEMGVRKSFGASRGRLLGQVLMENFILTLVGGIIGFVFAWLFLRSGMGGMFVEADYGMETRMTGETVFAPAIFILLLVLCMVLNIVSAIIPSYRALRRPIVESLKER